MTSKPAWLILAIFLLFVPIACATLGTAPAIAILGGAIVDPDSKAPPVLANVIIRADRIVAVGPDVRAPRGARIVNATGKFLLPGLWDMHAHFAALTEVARAPEHYVGFGVLATRDMGGDPDTLMALRRDIRADVRIGPEVFMAGPTLNGEQFASFHRVVRNEAEARATVRELAAVGVDYIKTHRATSREAFFAMLDEARRRKLSVVGHVPLAVSWIEAAQAGMRSMEHAQTLPENELSDAQTPASSVEEALARIDGARGDAIFAALAHADACFDPTLISYEESIDNRPDIAARRREAYAHLKAYVGRAHRAGVTILAGTDIPERHGDMLLLELERLAEAGLTPHEALAAATTNPARMMHRPDLARIATGAGASLLLLEADPTADVRNLRRLSTIVLRGRLIEADELARLRN